MTELTVLPNNPRLKIFNRIFIPIINLTPSYTRGLFRAYTHPHRIHNYRNIFRGSRPLFK